MNDTLTLDQLQIKRRELENELTALVQREQNLESDLKTKEKAVIEELQDIIADKKTIIETLESRSTTLNKKLKLLNKTPKRQKQEFKQIETDNTDEQAEDEVQFSVGEEPLPQTKKPNRKNENTYLF